MPKQAKKGEIVNHLTRISLAKQCCILEGFSCVSFYSSPLQNETRPSSLGSLALVALFPNMLHVYSQHNKLPL